MSLRSNLHTTADPIIETVCSLDLGFTTLKGQKAGVLQDFLNE